MSKKNLLIGGIVALVLIIIIVISTQQPNNSSNTSQSNSSKNIVQATTSFETIATVQDLKKRLDAKNLNDILLDVRTPQEFADGRIPDAVNLDMENPNFSSNIQKLDKTKTYIVFCRSGSRALTASQEMSKIGLKIVYSKGGITLWQSAGFAVVK